jgi:succinoglycan biosynthesis transport protein ExoP
MDSVNSPDSEYANASSEGFGIGAKDILATLRQDWLFPVFGCLIGLMLAVAYIVFVPAHYKSTARILLDTSVNRYLQTNKIADEIAYDEVAIASQVYILSSESIIVPLVRSMNLAHDLEFVGSRRDTQNLGYIDKLKNIVKQSIGWNGGADATIDPDAVRERTAVESLLNKLSVVRGNVANVIDVTFTSQDPKKAANIANAVADTYIESDLETRLKSTKTISQWLHIVKLRSEYRDLAAKVAELEPDLGPRHTAVVKLHKKMDELRRTIRDQEQLIAEAYANEYQMAKARESELAATVAQVTGEAGTDSQAQVKMREST